MIFEIPIIPASKVPIPTNKIIEFIFTKIKNANHFFKGKEKELSNTIDAYIKDKITII